MRMQCDIEIQVAVASAVQPLASLAGQAQALAVRGALGHARLEGAPPAVRETARAVLGCGQLESHLRAAVGHSDGDVSPDHVGLGRSAKCAAASSTDIHSAYR